MGSSAFLPVGAGALAVYLAAFRDSPPFRLVRGGPGVFLLTLLSPLNTLADGYLFSAHMAAAHPPVADRAGLLLLSLPRSLSLAMRPRVLAHPLSGWLAGVGAMWFWHAPALCNAAVSSRPVHALQTVSLLALGGLFWRQILAPREERAAFAASGDLLPIQRLRRPAAFSESSSPFRRSRSARSTPLPPIDRLGLLQTIRAGWGMTPERDQQIGGLLMWVPMCLIYLSAILAQIARWFAESGSPATEEI